MREGGRKRGAAGKRLGSESYRSYSGSNSRTNPIKPATTVAGLLNHIAGHVPRAGEQLDYEGLRFEVVEANQRKVLRLRVRPRILAAPLTVDRSAHQPSQSERGRGGNSAGHYGLKCTLPGRNSREAGSSQIQKLPAQLVVITTENLRAEITSERAM